MIGYLNNIVWGYILLVLMLGTGIYFTVKLKAFQFLHIPSIMKNTFFSVFSKKNSQKNSSGISPFQAASAALAAAMGTGNIIGVASALVIGGPGAVFWMWISAFFGMALVYAENYLGTVFSKNGKVKGTPAYLEYGTGKKYLAAAFCLFCSLASLGMGNMTQINSVSSAFHDTFGIPPIYTGLLCALPVFFIISGGIKRIGKLSAVLIPVLSFLYIAAALFIIVKFKNRLPEAFCEIFKGAFGIKAAGGGISGELIRRTVSTGLRRGVFSNEAGLGSSPLFHSESESSDPQRQGQWAAAEVFIDTVICCTVTALTVLVSGSLSSGTNGAALISETFSKAFGNAAPYFTSLSVALFAFATLISWYHCGKVCTSYIFGIKAEPFYRIIFVFCVVIGSYTKLETVWSLSDLFNGLMAIPNLTGVIMLRNKVTIRKRQ